MLDLNLGKVRVFGHVCGEGGCPATRCVMSEPGVREEAAQDWLKKFTGGKAVLRWIHNLCENVRIKVARTRVGDMLGWSSADISAGH